MRSSGSLKVVLTLLVLVALAAGLAGCSWLSSGKLTESDVNDVLASMKLTADTSADYRVDSAAFAASVLSQIPIYLDTADASATPTSFLPPDSPTFQKFTASQQKTVVAEALKTYRRVEKEKGSVAADQAMASATLNEGAGALSARDQGLMALLGEGATRLTFMFGEPDATQWTWKVTNVSVVGTDTADVTYSVAVPKGKAFSFAKSTFTKRLHFTHRSGDGRWILDGWLDYAAFESAVKAAVTPQSELPNMVPNWWDSLGAN